MAIPKQSFELDKYHCCVPRRKKKPKTYARYLHENLSKRLPL